MLLRLPQWRSYGRSLPTVFRQDWWFTQATTLHFCPLPAFVAIFTRMARLYGRPTIATRGVQYKRVHLFVERQESGNATISEWNNSGLSHSKVQQAYVCPNLFPRLSIAFLDQELISYRYSKAHLVLVMFWCQTTVDDVGDHLMPEQSVLCSPDDLCRAHKCLETSVFDALSHSSGPLYLSLLKTVLSHECRTKAHEDISPQG